MKIITVVKKNKIRVLFLMGLLLRISLLFYDFSWDINNHIVWAKDLHVRGFSNFFTTQSSEVFASKFPNYPPLSLFIFYLLYPLQSIIAKIAWYLNVSFPLFPSKLVFFFESRTFLAGIMKLPAVFADLGIAWLCFLFAKRFMPKKLKAQKLTAILILFNPVFFYTSALWGQIDSLPIFFVLTSLYLTIKKKHLTLGSIFFVIALLVKPTALVYMPIYLFLLVKQYGLKILLKSIFIATFVFWISFIPFTNIFGNVLAPFQIYAGKILSAQSLPYVTNGAFNFWVLITGYEGIKDTQPFLFTISYRFWGYATTALLFIFILRKLLRREKLYLYSFFLGAFAAFLFLTKMHERYSLLYIAFALFLYMFDRKSLLGIVLLSLISFLNLYHSWPVPKVQFLTQLIYTPAFNIFISFLNLSFFIFFFYKYIKSDIQ